MRETRHRFACGKYLEGQTAKNLTKQEEKTINNQPIIFNITYTPWKLKNNAAEEEREKSITKAEFGNLFSG